MYTADRERTLSWELCLPFRRKNTSAGKSFHISKTDFQGVGGGGGGTCFLRNGGGSVNESIARTQK